MSDLKHKLQAWVSAYAAFDEPVGLYTCTGCLKQFSDLDSAVLHIDEEEAFQRTAEMQLEEEKKAPAPKPEAPKPAEPPKVDPIVEAHKARMAALVASGKLVADAHSQAHAEFKKRQEAAAAEAPKPVKAAAAAPNDPHLQAHAEAKKRQQRQREEEADHQPKPAPTKVELKKCHDQCEPQEYLYFPCPHCGGEIQMKKLELNCMVARHATYKKSGEPVDPHASQVAMEFLVKSGAVRGCGLPFRVIPHEGSFKAVKSDWI